MGKEKKNHQIGKNAKNKEEQEERGCDNLQNECLSECPTRTQKQQ